MAGPTGVPPSYLCRCFSFFLFVYYPTRLPVIFMILVRVVFISLSGNVCAVCIMTERSHRRSQLSENLGRVAFYVSAELPTFSDQKNGGK